MNLFWTSFLIVGGLKCSRAQFGPWVLEVLPSDEADGAEWQVFEDGHKAAFDVAEDAQSAKLTAEAWLKERVHDIRAYAKRKAIQGGVNA